MIKLLFGIILIFGLIILFTGAIGISFLRAIFGLGKRNKQSTDDRQSQTRNYPENREKVFGDDVGEYVDFEEITPKSTEKERNKEDE